MSLAILESPERAGLLLDPTRRRLLEALRDPGSAASVAASLGLPRQRVNYHVRALEKAGLLELVEERRKGNCTERVLRATARHYLVAPQALGALGVRADDVTDRFSSAYLLAVASQAIRDVTKLRAGADAAGKRLATLALETEVRFASARDQHAFAEELAAGIAALVSKYHAPAGARGRTYRFFLGGHPKPAASAEPGDADDREGS